MNVWLKCLLGASLLAASLRFAPGPVGSTLAPATPSGAPGSAPGTPWADLPPALIDASASLADAGSRRKIARLLESQGDVRDAIEILSQILDDDPEDRDCAVELSDLASRRFRFEEGHALLRALAFRPSAGFGAIESLYRYILLNVPLGPPGYRWEGLLDATVKEWGATHPLDFRTCFHLGRMLASPVCGDVRFYRQALTFPVSSRDLAMLERMACEFDADGMYDDEERTIRTGLTVDPGSENLWRGLGRVLLRQDRVPEALEAFRRRSSSRRIASRTTPMVDLALEWVSIARRPIPSLTDLVLSILEAEPPGVELASLAGYLARAGHEQAAETALRRQIARNAGSAQAWFGLADLLAGQGRRDEAVEAYRTFASRARDKDPVLVRMARYLESIGRLSEAEKALRERVAVGRSVCRGRPWEPYGDLVAFQERRGCSGAAVTVAWQALADVPADSHVLFRACDVLERNDRADGAIEALRAALQTGLSGPGILDRLSGLLVDRRRFAEAEPYCEKLVRLRRRNASALFRLARIIDAQGHPARAGLIARSILSLPVSRVEELDELGRFFLERDQLEDAASAFAQAFEMGHRGSGDELLRVARRRLERGRVLESVER